MPSRTSVSQQEMNSKEPARTTQFSDLLECGTSLTEHEHRQDDADVPKQTFVVPSSNNSLQSVDALRSFIASDIVKGDSAQNGVTMFASPFEVPPGAVVGANQQKQEGRRFLQVPLVYCDQTASNRPLQSIETYMQRVCLPLLGNTHTNTSITGSQSTAFVAEARQIVAEECNAKITGKASQDVVLFAGNGATSAVELLIDCLGLHHAADRAARPVVFVGPYEHHSNLIPWRETGCEIIMVPESSTTKQVDCEALEMLLAKPEYSNRLKMGTFAAASNVTGKISDVDRITSTLHRHGALAFFDYATAAPYMRMDMNPPPSDQYPSASMIAKDAIFLSPHKMLGGVGTPGVLIIKKSLVSQVNAPHRAGGGTVFYVTNTHHRFLSNRIARYEGGTPNVTGIMRAGLTVLMKRKVEEQFKLITQKSGSESTSVEDFDCAEYERIATYLKENAPNLVLLGSGESGRNLPVFSFLIRCGNRFLHYNYVCAILNDVFGIQSRGGCQCAGPYSQRLLGLTEIIREREVPNLQNEQIEAALLRYKERAELLRPGYTRLSLPFKGLRPEEVDYVLKALVWVSKNGWALMCQYRCNHRTGEWRHASRQGRPLGRDERKWLSHFDFTNASRQVSDSVAEYVDLKQVLSGALNTADALLAVAKKDQRSIAQTLKLADADDVLGKNDEAGLENLRWYVYPKECAEALTSESGFMETVNVPLEGALDPLQEKDGNLHERKRSNDDMNRSSMTTPSIAVVPGSTDLFSFRDGEHMGEATYEEIEEGVEDGELSEKCEIFDVDIGEWVEFPNFVRKSKKVKINIALGGTVAQTDSVGPDEHKERTGWKKACRDSNQWGKGSIAIQPTAVLPEQGCGVQPMEMVQDAAPIKKDRDQKQEKKKKFKDAKPPAKMMRLVTQALIQWEMIQEGDRLLLGLSGGKDSLSLLHCLLEFQRKLPVKFDIEVCTIDPMTPSFDPSGLIPYVESLGLKYHYIRDDIVSRASSSGKSGKMVSSLCAFCARMKRGNLYSCARKNSCNKLVLAQHLDDCAESFLMSVMHNGFLRTMKANYKIDSGDLSVIRPMIYCRESLMTDFAKSANLPVVNENCPACFEEPKERARVKKLLSREETLYPNFYDNIRRSLIPLMHDDAARILRSMTEEIVVRSRKEKGSKKAKGGVDSSNGDADVSHAPQSFERDSVSISQASDDDLIREIARRRADRSRQLKASQGKTNDVATGITDATGQVCSLDGGNGTIPCRELME